MSLTSWRMIRRFRACKASAMAPPGGRLQRTGNGRRHVGGGCEMSLTTTVLPTTSFLPALGVTAPDPIPVLELHGVRVFRIRWTRRGVRLQAATREFGR